MTGPTAREPWTVTLAWTPEQNSGRVSILDGRAPAFAPVYQVWAGDTVAAAAEEFGCSPEAVEVLLKLAEEAGDWA